MDNHQETKPVRSEFQAVVTPLREMVTECVTSLGDGDSLDYVTRAGRPEQEELQLKDKKTSRQRAGQMCPRQRFGAKHGASCYVEEPHTSAPIP